MTKDQDPTNDRRDQWVSSLLQSARKDNPLFAEAVFLRLDTLLKGQLSERDLTPTQLRTAATQLIEDMVPKPPKPEETQ